MSEPYPESSGTGNMLLKKDPHTQPVDCMRIMVQKTRACPTGKITFPGDVVTLMHDMEDMDRERAMILHLDTKNSILGVENISTGTLNSSLVHPRESLKGAILNNSANIIFVHNHPSGDPLPSREDREINKRLQEAFKIVGIDMLDSIIIGREGYYSAKEHGELFEESKYNKVGERRIMEESIAEEDEVCSTATMAAMSVISEQCGSEESEPEQGRFLRLHIKQEIKHIHALALGTVTHPGHTAQSYAEHTKELIDNGVENDNITPEFADVLKQAVQKAVQGRPYLEVIRGVRGM